MAEKKRVLLVEDDRNLNELNRRALQDEGYAVTTALNIAEARACLLSAAPDAIILDIALPDGSGVDFCREIRQTTAAPILFLTSVRGYQQTLEGLASGGDDYLNKPFDLQLLLTKVKSFLRRDEIVTRVRQPGKTLARGPLALDLVASQAFLNGEDMLLSHKEFALLLLLVRNEGKPLTKEYLYEAVWGAPIANDGSALWKQMSRLNIKLQEGSGGKATLTMTRGVGYRLDIVE